MYPVDPFNVRTYSCCAFCWTLQNTSSVEVCLFELRYLGPVKRLGSCRARSVDVITLFLSRIGSLSDQPVIVHILSSVTENCPFWLSRWENSSGGVIWPRWVLKLHPMDLQSGALPTMLWSPALLLRLLHVSSVRNYSCIVWVFRSKDPL